MCLHTVLLFRILKQIHILQLLLQSLLLLLLLLPYYYSTTATTTLLTLLLLLSECLSVSTLLQYSSLYIQILYYYFYQMKITYILTTTPTITTPTTTTPTKIKTPTYSFSLKIQQFHLWHSLNSPETNTQTLTLRYQYYLLATPPYWHLYRN